MDKLRLFILVMSASYLVTQIKSDTTPRQKTIICYGNTRSLECSEDEAVWVDKALYGANNPEICESKQGEPQCESKDITMAFWKRCLGESVCELRPSNRHTDIVPLDPCLNVSGQYKYFEIEFHCCSRCPARTYGCFCIEDCECRPCHCQGNCHREEGVCETEYNCTSGWYGRHCNYECLNGTFGQNCSKDCHCQDVCDKKTGSCPSNCESGWHGIDCQQECQDYNFGLNCSNTCRCSNTSEVCDKVTGGCLSGCLPGWKDKDCQQQDGCYDDPCGIHTCQEGGGDFSCKCLHGYENLSSRECADIDECVRYDACGRHTCINEEGSYECMCYNDSYDNIAHQICVEDLTIDPETVIIEHFFPKEILVKIVIIALSANIIVFFAIVASLCARTVVRVVHKVVTTEPYDRKEQVISFAHVDVGQFQRGSHVMIISELSSEDVSNVNEMESVEIFEPESEDCISVNEIEKDMVSFHSVDCINVDQN